MVCDIEGSDSLLAHNSDGMYVPISRFQIDSNNILLTYPISKYDAYFSIVKLLSVQNPQFFLYGALTIILFPTSIPISRVVKLFASSYSMYQN